MRAAIVGLTLLGLETAADAQAVVERRNFSAERFRLSLDKNGLLSTEWAEVPRHLSWDVSLWLGYADDPLALYRERDGGRERVGPLVHSRLGGGVMVAIGLLDWVQVGLELPLVLYQDRQDTLPGVNGRLVDLSRFGVGSPRIAPKLRILDEESFGVGLALVPAFIIPTTGRDNYFGQDSLQFEPEVVASKRWGEWRGAVNLGLRLRRPEALADLDVDNEIFARLAAGYRLSELGVPPLELEAVLSTATALGSPFTERNQNHVETLLGAAYDFDGPLMAFAAGGLGINQGYGTPDWRVLVGLRISDHDRDSDKDGIVDDADRCPDEPEDRDGFADTDGCPDPDNDRDGVLDGDDLAPLAPEDPDDFEDQDGLPDPDNDADGSWDWDDRCPETPGPVEAFGCPVGDADADGVPDHLDRCPERVEDRDGFEDADGCPDLDDDADGVLDTEDRCRLEPGPAAGAGCPDADRDGDTVLDRLDNCPDEPGPTENRGCKEKQLVMIVGDRLDILDKVYFDTARAKIKPRSFALLDNVATVLVAHPELTRVEVQGHTDDRGRAASNLRLSQRRAEAVAAYLVDKGVEQGRLRAQGYGETSPISTNATAGGRAENRRVEFRIKEKSGPASGEVRTAPATPPIQP